jgi:hypothetical protein
MTSLDVSSNNLGAVVLPVGWELDKSISSWDVAKWFYKHIDGREQKGHPGQPDGLIAIVNAIPDMGALFKICLASNGLRAGGGELLAAALANNNNNGTLLELDVSSNDLAMSNWRHNVSFSDSTGVIALADTVKHMGAILSVNLLENSIYTNQAEALVSMINEHPTLKSLCGNRGNETELDMSGKDMGASGAIMLAAEIVGNKALTKLDISNNNMEQLAGRALQQITEWCCTKGVELDSHDSDDGGGGDYDY